MIFYERGYQAAPPGLVSGTQAVGIIALVIFVKKQQVFIFGPLVKPVVSTVHGPLAIVALFKDADHFCRQRIGYLFKIVHIRRARGERHSKRIAIKFVTVVKRLDDEVIEWHPHRATPVTVAAKHAVIAFGGQVANVVTAVVKLQTKRVFLVKF